MSGNIYGFEASSIDGRPVRLQAYAGKPVLIVNVASKCGLTPQYEGLEALYRKYEGRGLAILGFPCDQFGHQEPGSDSEIQQFCSLTYGVSFPLFSKIEVNGAGAHPLYRFLRAEKPAPVSAEQIKGNQLYQYLSAKLPDLLAGDSIRWNFTKFLVGRDGTVLKRYDPTVMPEEIEKDLLQVL